MRKLNILLLDWRLSRSLIEVALSSELNSSIFNLPGLLREQLEKNDDLGKELRRQLDSGEMFTTEILGRLILKNLKLISGDILLSGYPRTKEQYDGLRKILKQDNIEPGNIWYFKQRDPNQFMKDHFKNPEEKQWIDKYGSEVIEHWKTKFNERREQIIEIQHVSDKTKWKVIEVDYVMDLSIEYIKQQIKDYS